MSSLPQEKKVLNADLRRSTAVMCLKSIALKLTVCNLFILHVTRFSIVCRSNRPFNFNKNYLLQCKKNKVITMQANAITIPQTKTIRLFYYLSNKFNTCILHFAFCIHYYKYRDCLMCTLFPGFKLQCGSELYKFYIGKMAKLIITMVRFKQTKPFYKLYFIEFPQIVDFSTKIYFNTQCIHAFASNSKMKLRNRISK